MRREIRANSCCAWCSLLAVGAAGMLVRQVARVCKRAGSGTAALARCVQSPPPPALVSIPAHESSCGAQAIRSLRVSQVFIRTCSSKRIDSETNNPGFRFTFETQDEEWSDLTMEDRDNWMTLGWEEESWDLGLEPPAQEEYYWNQLSDEQQSAARSLGYDAHSWYANISASPIEIVIPSSLSGTTTMNILSFRRLALCPRST